MVYTLLNALAWCTGYSFACLVSGRFLTRWIDSTVENSKTVSVSAGLATFFLLGQGALAALWIFLALLGWLSPQIVAAMLLAIIALGFLKVPRWAVAAAERIKPMAVAFWEESFGFKILGILTLILVLLEGLSSLLPPTSGSDAEAFYLALPKLISASHRLLPMPGGFEYFSQIGLQGEMHFSALMSVSNYQAAKLFVWPTSLAIGLMLMGLGSLVGLGRHGNYISVAILFTSTVFTNIIWDGKVDLFATAMGLCAYYWALQLSTVKGALPLAGLSRVWPWLLSFRSFLHCCRG